MYMHISCEIDSIIETFIPRIPVSTMEGEDRTVPRVCVAPSLRGCLTAHPSFYYHFVEYIDMRYSDPYEFMSRFFTRLEDKVVGCIVIAYYFSLDTTSSSLWEPTLLSKRNFVPDAAITGEAWILETITPDNWEYLFIENPKDIANSDSDLKYSHLGKSLDGFENYLDTFMKEKKRA